MTSWCRIVTKCYFNMQKRGGGRLEKPSPHIHDLYCAMEGQVCAASLHVSDSTRSVSVPKLQQKHREQRCFPAEQPGRGAGPWHGGQPIGYPGMVSFRCKCGVRLPGVKRVFHLFHLFDREPWNSTLCPQINFCLHYHSFKIRIQPPVMLRSSLLTLSYFRRMLSIIIF